MVGAGRKALSTCNDYIAELFLKRLLKNNLRIFLYLSCIYFALVCLITLVSTLLGCICRSCFVA